MRTILDTVASLRRSPTNWIVTPDRIAEQAKANKRLVYVDFGNKEQLFETIVGGLSPLRTTGPAGLLVWLSRRSRLLWQPPARR